MKIGFISLGCSKNQVDSERVMGLLKANGHTLTKSLDEASAIFVNTCGFINPAKEESINTILDMAEYKQKNLKKLIVIGCLSQRYKEDLIKELPEVDRFIGVSEYNKLDEILSEVLETEIIGSYGKMERLISKKAHTAYLKIAEGCSNRCTYCAIPLIRGPLNSYPKAELLLEAQHLILRGVKELVLIAQDTTRYMEDQGSNQLGQLLKELNALPGLKWIRILYMYPNAVSKALLMDMKACDKVIPYFDIPIQHADNDLLKAMARKGTVEDIRQVIHEIREVFPQAILRTTLIVGFPGEIQKQFQALLDFIQEIKFDRLGAFAYSLEEDTPAYFMKDSCSETEKQERLLQVMDLQAKISEEKIKAMIGSTLDVLIDSKDRGTNTYRGRSIHYAPDQIDGEVVFTSDQALKIGTFAKVNISRNDEYDLYGEHQG
ncbi:MAG: ribosomal protein S12 methylthiotransferase [Erysipelotrichaceae bacterium]|nr:MAG: ribosomal protein S12 [Erysipelotrichaceae bacterium]TXT18987.1 MAG: ribosomal protein S12 methylthiotransferase [Erysipelotrichaceae bacterium]